jgi:dolichyl-phosphate-mannose--protein O-mannosyl transferase
VYYIDSVHVGVITFTNHLYHNCRALNSWLPLIFRIRQFFQTAELSYALPAHRATVFIMGIALGFLLRYCGRDFRLKKVCVRFEVICVVTVNIAVCSVVTKYWPMFFGYLLLAAAWWNSKPHPYKTAFAGLLFPIGFFTIIDPNHLFLLLLLFFFICFYCLFLKR